jgi:leukotriene-A4 hydrolase
MPNLESFLISLVTQCQAIHCRTLFPCQDTPDVKAPVYYCLRSPYPIIASGHFSGDTVLHGGPWNSVGHYPGSKFEQRIPIPSYLIAIASGDITSQPIGPRSVVVTSPDEIAKCKWELENDMEKFLEAAESIVFKYQWGTYNVLVLPPSFPYGGMENPIYTFATPTIISGDRQNIDVIAHELAHSWSGNLVSNASWEHFWLNEGWTTYLERRIQAKIHGEPHRDFSAIIGWKALQDSVDRYGSDHEFTKLVINLDGQDPDDAFSTVPYDKGYTFLDYLERLLGRDEWDEFIPHYFRTWMLKSLDSFEFKATLEDFFKDKKEQSKLLSQVDWQTWFYKPGMPPKPPFDDSMVKACTELANKWQSRGEKPDSFVPAPSDTKDWVGNQCVVFLETMQLNPEKISLEDCRLLNKTYNFEASQNVEISARSLVLSLMKKDEKVFDATADLLSKVGRMKFVRPLYRYLKDCSLGYAINVFEKNKNFYHPICRSMVEKDLYGKEAKA